MPATHTVSVDGYKVHFVEDIDTVYKCSQCNQVMREPYTTTCKHHFCRDCIEDAKKNTGRPCPKCDRKDFARNASLDVHLLDKINALTVRCPMGRTQSTEYFIKPLKHECPWIGMLEDVESHLSSSSIDGDCRYVKLGCPQGCGAKFPRKELEKHKLECRKRPYCCNYCNYEATYEEIITNHYPNSEAIVTHCADRCQKYPVSCQCGKRGIEYGRVDRHLKERCPLIEVECEFRYAGCTEVVPRGEMGVHMEKGMKRHLAMVDRHCKQLRETVLELQQRLKEVSAQNYS